MKLYDLMQEKGYSVRSLAKEAGVSPSIVGYILNGRKGQTHYAGPDIRRKISKALEVEATSIDEFVAAINHYKGKDQPARVFSDAGWKAVEVLTALSAAS